MKKSVLSIVLCLAMILTAMSAMLVMPASAANGVDFLATGAANGNAEGLDFTHENGVLTFNATAAGQEVALVVPGEANLNDYPFVVISIESTGAFDLCFNDANNGKWIGGASDYNYAFGSSDYAKIPAGSYTDAKMDLTGYYTYNFGAMPANAALKQIIFIAEEPGTITVTKAMVTDGLEDVSLNSASYNEADTWNANASIIPTDPAAWSAAANNAGLTSEIVVSNDADGNLVFGNTAGAYPAAYAPVGMTVPYEDSAVYFDFTVTSHGQTTVYLFFGAATETDFDGEGKGYYAVVGDVTASNYSGYVYIKDMIPADSDLIDADGNVTISVIKAFGTTAGAAATACEKAMVLREATVYYNEAVEIPEGTYITYTMETATHEGSIAEGEEITLNVTASEVADINGVNLHITYDDAQFEFVNAEWKGVLADFVAAEGNYANVNTENEPVDGVKEIRVSAMANASEVIYDTAADEVILTLTLKAKTEIAEDAEVAISYAEVTSNASTINKYPLIAEAVNGGVVIEAPAGILGDVNLDEEVDIFDVLRLFKYVGEEIEELEPQALLNADVNLDEEVDIFDVLRLFKFVGEEIEEL